MTKQIRIENADLSTHPVRVTVQHKNHETGVWADDHSVQINNPTEITSHMIHSHRRIVIEELAADPAPQA